jgi:hypothetical protein
MTPRIGADVIPHIGTSPFSFKDRRMKPLLYIAAIIALAGPAAASDTVYTAMTFAPDVGIHGLSDYVVRAMAIGPYGPNY